MFQGQNFVSRDKGLCLDMLGATLARHPVQPVASKCLCESADMRSLTDKDTALPAPAGPGYWRGHCHSGTLSLWNIVTLAQCHSNSVILAQSDSGTV